MLYLLLEKIGKTIIHFLHSVFRAYFLQEASAVAGHGEVSEQTEGEFLDGGVIRRDPRGQLRDTEHQRAARSAFTPCCRSRATNTHTAAG